MMNHRPPSPVSNPAPQLPQVMQFRVGRTITQPGPSGIPSSLPGRAANLGSPVNTRYITLNEIKFPAPTGPLTAKGVVNFQGNVFVHWGEVISYHEIDLNCLNCANAPPLGMPWQDRFTTADFGDISAGGRSRWSSRAPCSARARPAGSPATATSLP